tara:strand:- start:6912 stop:7553 length:642 start_codon:yes stop_codon:yes gene_type:complete
MSSTYSKYLNEDSTLNLQLIYTEMSIMDPFGRKNKQESLYNDVLEWYKDNIEVTKPVTNLVPKTVTKMSHKNMKEQDVVDLVNKASNREFYLVDDEFSRYDAEDSDYIAEIKVRYKWYPDCIIEKKKYDANMLLAKEKNKEFLYIVFVNQDTCYDLYVFNCSKLTKLDYGFRWDLREMPKSTELGHPGKKIIMKEVGFMDIDKASAHYGVKDA